ncbi:uncharacterized protein LOC108668451 [Hyalella azteca]|uniref:Uncharacterized protein LOC108668451 n=1 Tax=Hyalella azteca TaxID=294128 RepID=A0A8B7NCA0_HYAAZ|nr:uncharacterized protein LOC108668451 [Hyalella azteca]
MVDSVAEVRERDATKPEGSEASRQGASLAVTAAGPSDANGSAVAAPNAPQQEVSSNVGAGFPHPTPLPAWFQKYFPLLSHNLTFLIAYWYIVSVVTSIKEAFLVDMLLRWISLLLIILHPAIVIMKWWFWLIFTLTMKPGLMVAKYIAGLLGITHAIKVVCKELIRAIDYYGDKLMKTIGNLVAYVRNQWEQTRADIIKALTTLRQWATETLEALVRAIKYVLHYVSDILSMILPARVYRCLKSWLHVAYTIMAKIYYFIKYLLTSFEEILQIIKNAWNTDVKNFFSSARKRSTTIPAKNDASTVRPTELSIDDSVKPRKVDSGYSPGPGKPLQRNLNVPIIEITLPTPITNGESLNKSKRSRTRSTEQPKSPIGMNLTTETEDMSDIFISDISESSLDGEIPTITTILPAAVTPPHNHGRTSLLPVPERSTVQHTAPLTPDSRLPPVTPTSGSKRSVRRTRKSVTPVPEDSEIPFNVHSTPKADLHSSPPASQASSSRLEDASNASQSVAEKSSFGLGMFG